MSDSKKVRTHFLDESEKNKFIDPREKSRKRRFNWQEELDKEEEIDLTETLTIPIIDPTESPEKDKKDVKISDTPDTPDTPDTSNTPDIPDTQKDMK